MLAIDRLLTAVTLITVTLLGGCASPRPPIADVHLHYNWNQAETIAPEAAVAKLDANNVVLAVVSSTPTEQAFELAAADPEGRVQVMFSPYLDPTYRFTWFAHPEVVEQAREGLASGRYVGIGEVHVVSGLGPRRDNAVLQGLLRLAAEYNVPFLIHTEASSWAFFAPLCRDHADVRMVWAHAGGKVPPEQVGTLLAECPNVWVDLSARDTWRYVRNPITGADGRLLPGWDTVVRAYPGRFLIGADALWPVEQLHGWERADTGWQRIDDFYTFHRTWLAAMPDEVAERVRLTNALALFDRASGAAGKR